MFRGNSRHQNDSLVSLLLTVNIFLRFYTVFIVDFEQVNGCCEVTEIFFQLVVVKHVQTCLHLPRVTREAFRSLNCLNKVNREQNTSGPYLFLTQQNIVNSD